MVRGRIANRVYISHNKAVLPFPNFLYYRPLRRQVSRNEKVVHHSTILRGMLLKCCRWRSISAIQSTQAHGGFYCPAAPVGLSPLVCSLLIALKALPVTCPLSKRKVNSLRTGAFLLVRIFPSGSPFSLLPCFAGAGRYGFCPRERRPLGSAGGEPLVEIRGWWASDSGCRAPGPLSCESSAPHNSISGSFLSCSLQNPGVVTVVLILALGSCSLSLAKSLQWIPSRNKLPLDDPNLNVPSVYSWDPNWCSPSHYPML